MKMIKFQPRERKRTIYLLHEIVMCKYIHAYTFVLYSERKEKNQNHKELFVHFDMQKTTV